MYGWTQILGGLVAIGIGIWSMVSPESSRMWLGAFVFGPFLIFRGIRALQEDSRTKRPNIPAGPEGVPSESVNEVADQHAPPMHQEPKTAQELARAGASFVEVACEQCRENYVYFPEADELAARQYRIVRNCAAPCPGCGWLQSHMIDFYGQFPHTHWSERLMIPAGLLALGSAAFLAFNFNNFYGAGAQPDPYESIYWYANLAVFLGALVCGIIFVKGIYRRPNPNEAPLELRLKKGSQLGMMRAELESLQKGTIDRATGIQVLESRSRDIRE
jgi:hypothetical protein